MSKHAELSGSSAHRWIRCHGSIALLRTIPRSPSGPAARQGTMAHAFGEQILDYHIQTGEGERGLRARFKPTASFKYVDHDERCVGEIDQEMIDHVMTYVNYMMTYDRRKIHLEVHVDLKNLVRPNMWGTSDAVVNDTDMLVVADFKYGFTPVRVFTEEHGPNEQLLYYAAGALDLFKWKHKTVRLVIAQPRCPEVEPIQTYELTAGEVRQWAETTLLEAAHAVDYPGAKLVAGEHCRFCDAQAVCPKIQEETNKLAMTDFSLSEPATPQVPEKPVDLARVLKAAPMIDSWLRACEEAAFNALQSGQKVPGFKLVRKKSNRAWPTEDVAKLAKLLKLRPAQLLKSEVMSPAQLEKVFGKELVARVATKPEGGLTVAAESDKRAAVDTAGDFADIL